MPCHKLDKSWKFDVLKRLRSASSSINYRRTHTEQIVRAKPQRIAVVISRGVERNRNKKQKQNMKHKSFEQSIRIYGAVSMARPENGHYFINTPCGAPSGRQSRAGRRTHGANGVCAFRTHVRAIPASPYLLSLKCGFCELRSSASPSGSSPSSELK